MKIRFAVAAGVAAVAALVGIGVSTASATPTHWKFDSTLQAQVDDSHFGDWAKDKLTRTTIVDQTGPTTYTMKLVDEGSFDTSSYGINPGDGTPLHRTVTGTVTGGATIVVQSTTGPQQPNIAGGNTKSSNWAKLVFSGFISQSDYPWSWTYSTKCEHYTQATKGESGSITGKLCHIPSPSPSPTTTSKPPVTTTITSPAPTTVVLPPVTVPVKVTVNPGQFAVTPNTSKGIDTGDGSLS